MYTPKPDGEVDPEIVNEHHAKLKELEQDFIKSMKPIIDFQELAAKREQERQVQSKPTALGSTTPLTASLPVQMPAQDVKPLGTTMSPTVEILLKSVRANSMHRMLRMLLMTESMGMRLSSPQETPRQLTNSHPCGTNNNDAILRALASPLRLTPTGGPSPSILLDSLKRKFENKGSFKDDTMCPPNAKRPRN